MPDWGEIFADPKMQRLPPNPEVMAGLFPRYTVLRLEAIQTPIPFMGGKVMPQLVFLGKKTK